MRKLTKILFGAMLFFGIGTAFADEVPAPVFKVDGNTVENATMAVPEGTKVILTNGTESDAMPLPIYYNIKGTGSEEFNKVTTQAELTKAVNNIAMKLIAYPSAGIEITKETPINAATADIDEEGNITWSTVITKNFTIGTETPNPSEKPAAPTFEPDGGEVDADQEITLTSTAGADIYYIYRDETADFFTQYGTQDELDEAKENDWSGDQTPIEYSIYAKPRVDEWGAEAGSTVSISAAAVMVSADGKLTWSDATTKQFTIKEEELPEGAVAKPVIDPGNDATVRMGDMVTIECATEGAEIYYTTDGSKAYTTDEKGNNITGINESAIRYTESFALNESMLIEQGNSYSLKINAIATKGDVLSDAAAAGYVVYPDEPTFSPVAGAVVAGTKVEINCVPAVADIYYTTDGSAPTMENSPKYTEPIEITEAMTIKALAVLGQYQESASASYTISGSTPVEPEPEAWFTLSPVAGSTVNVGDEITISSDEDPDFIMYQWFATKAEAESAEYSFTGGWSCLGDDGKPVVEAGKPFLAVTTVTQSFTEIAGMREVVEYTISGFTPVDPNPTRPDAPEISPVAGAYFAGTCITVSSPSWWEGTDTVYYCLGTKNGAYTTAVPDTTEDGEYIGDRVSFALTADTTVWMFLVDKNGVHSDTVDARYTLKAAPSFDGSVEVLNPTAKANSGFNAPDSVYTATPVFQAKVEGLALTFNKILLRYRCYQNAGNTLVAEAFSSDEEFSLTAKNGGKLANGTYMVVVDVVEKGEDDMDGNPIFVAYTKNGAAVEAVRYITIAAPAWTLVSPELNTEPYLLRNGKDLEVVIAAENCNGLFGRGGSKMQVVKRIYANSLFKSPADAVDGLLGKAIYYEMVDNTEVNGEIRFTLPEGWADSVRKVLTAAVQEAYEEWEAESWEDIFYEMYGLKDENDLSDCLVEIMPFETVKQGSDSYFMLAEKYEYMSVSVPFTVVDTIFAPTFSLDGGVVEKGYELMITADMASDTIYYRENEGAFKKAGSEVKVTIESDMTVAAYAVSKEGKKSDTVEARFIIAPSMDVKPAGNFKMVGDTALLFTDSIPLFDILLGETDYQEFGIVAQLYTEEAFGNYNAPMKELSLEAKDSVRVNFDTVLVGGEYVATFALQATRGSEERFVEIHFRAGKDSEDPIGPTAVEAGELAGVRVYPNPNAGTFSVDVPERARVEIFGLNGALLMSREVNAGVAAFNLDHSGIYFVRVTANNKTAVKRVVVR